MLKDLAPAPRQTVLRAFTNSNSWPIVLFQPSSLLSMTRFTRNYFVATVIALFLAVFAFPLRAQALDYYVSTIGNDSSDGSSANPWLTIQHAASVVAAGDVVHVAPGTYVGPVIVSASGTSTSRIRFVSDSQFGAQIRTSSADAVWTNNGDYVDIEGFDIAGDSSTYLGIVNWGSFVRIIGNLVHDIPAPNAYQTGRGGAGIEHANYSAHDNDIIGNIVHDIGDYASPNPSVHGIYHANLRGRVWNNVSYRNQGWGIHLWHSAYQISVCGNLVHNNGYGGILVGGDPDTDDFTEVKNNMVMYNGRYGISEYGSTGTHNQYLNNVVYQNVLGSYNLQNGLSDSGTVGADSNSSPAAWLW